MYLSARLQDSLLHPLMGGGRGIDKVKCFAQECKQEVTMGNL